MIFADFSNRLVNWMLCLRKAAVWDAKLMNRACYLDRVGEHIIGCDLTKQPLVHHAMVLVR